MTTFSFSKSVDDIAPPVLMEEDWYIAVLTDDPEIKPNAKKEKGLSEEDGAGDNLVLKLMIAEGEHQGRRFNVYLPYPSEQDMERIDGIGMNVYDAKLELISDFAEKATGCSVDGSEITIRKNARVGVYVSTGQGRDKESIVNSIEVFRHGFMKASDIDTGLGISSEDAGDADSWAEDDYLS